MSNRDADTAKENARVNHGETHPGSELYHWCAGCEEWIYWSDYVQIGGHRLHG